MNRDELWGKYMQYHSTASQLNRAWCSVDSFELLLQKRFLEDIDLLDKLPTGILLAPRDHKGSEKVGRVEHLLPDLLELTNLVESFVVLHRNPKFR